MTPRARSIGLRRLVSCSCGTQRTDGSYEGALRPSGACSEPLAFVGVLASLDKSQSWCVGPSVRRSSRGAVGVEPAALTVASDEDGHGSYDIPVEFVEIAPAQLGLYELRQIWRRALESQGTCRLTLLSSIARIRIRVLLLSRGVGGGMLMFEALCLLRRVAAMVHGVGLPWRRSTVVFHCDLICHEFPWLLAPRHPHRNFTHTPVLPSMERHAVDSWQTKCRSTDVFVKTRLDSSERRSKEERS